MPDHLSISSEHLWEVVERSASFEERLAGKFVPDARNDDTELLKRRMAAWRRNSARDDEEVFSKRLEWDGLDVPRARALVGRVKRATANEELPRWAQLLRQVVESSQEPCDGARLQHDLASVRGEQPVVFEELFYPWLRLAREKLQNQVGAAYSLLAEVAHRQWERSLLLCWEAMAGETLFEEFSGFRDAHKDPRHANTSQELYQSFLCSLQGVGLLRLFLRYPVLARLLSSSLCHWVDAAKEFLCRLEGDQAELEKRFNQGQPLGPIIRLEPGMSDRHRAGRTVMRMQFAAGVGLIYKPKIIAAEVSYWNLVRRVNRCAGLPLLLTLQVLDRAAYGWVEEVQPCPCQSYGDVEAFYYRAGMLLCLIYALEGSDCHGENLIAVGEHPVLIDHETLMRPRIRYLGPAGEKEPLFLASQFFYDESIIRTGLLPWRQIRPSGESYDFSGLGGTEMQVTHWRKRIWENINTDAMRFRMERTLLPPSQNVVVLDGKRLEAACYAGQIAAGFEHLYRFLLAWGTDLMDREDLLRNWSGLRFVFRETWIYGSMLKRLFSPLFLRDGMDASIELELFTRPFLYAEHRPLSWPILADERRSLLQGDIPFFQYAAEGDALLLESGESIPHFFGESGISQVQRRFASLGEEDLKRQLDLLRASFELQGDKLAMTDTTSGPSEVPVEDHASPDDFLAEACRIAHEIRRAARTFQDGASWNTIAYYAKAQHWQLAPMPLRFYDGLCGVALFLSAAQKFRDGPELSALARSALRTVAGVAVRPDCMHALFEQGIGAGVGQSSIIYALVRASELLGQEEWLVHAQRLADLLDAERIASDRDFDLMMGAAGAVLALLALYRSTGIPEVLAKATMCGEHLLRHRSPSHEGPRAWKTVTEKMLTGFSHGAAGIAYALLKLYEATGESSFLEAALEAQAYETSVFLADVSNWPDFRQPATKDGYAHATSWCHGAPGIVLSRLAGLPVLDNLQIRWDISHGLRTTRIAGTQGLDTVCCGAMGRVEVLIVAAQKLGDPAYLEQAEQMASSILRRSRQCGNYKLGFKDPPYIASFHQGMAGIGYEFLRLAAPASLPSLLLWE